MLKKKKELSVEDWVDEINNGLKYRQRYGLEKQWAEIEAVYYNQHDSQLNAGPNIIFSSGDALLSELNTPNPYLTLKPRKPEFIAGSKILEVIDNTLIDDLQMQTQVGRSLHCAYLFANGILKFGFDSEYGFDPTHDAGGTNTPTGATFTQTDSKTGNLIEYRDQVKPGMPWMTNVLPHDFVVPWGVIDVEEAAWVAHRVVRHVDDIKADPKYENKKDLKAVMSMEDWVKSYQTTIKPYRMGSEVLRRNTGEGNAEYCELWEIHDKRTGKIIVIATGHDEFLRNETNLLQLAGLPFIGYSFTPRSRTFWTTSDALYLRRHQAELSDITVQATKLRRLMNFKFLYDEDMIDNTELEKAISHEAGIGIKIKSNGKPIEDAFHFITPPPNYELANQAQQVRQSSKETIGFNSNNFGEYQTGRKTAREVDAVQEGQGQRMSRRQAVLRNIYVQAFRKINPMLEKFWKQDRVMQVVGPNGSPLWFQFNGSHLGGEYDYSCGFSDTAPETKDQRKQQALQIWQALSMDPMVNRMALAQYLANAFNDVEFSSIFTPGVLNGVPSADQQLQQQGIQQMQQQQQQQPQLPPSGSGQSGGARPQQGGQARRVGQGVPQ